MGRLDRSERCREDDAAPRHHGNRRFLWHDVDRRRRPHGSVRSAACPPSCVGSPAPRHPCRDAGIRLRLAGKNPAPPVSRLRGSPRCRDGSECDGGVGSRRPGGSRYCDAVRWRAAAGGPGSGDRPGSRGALAGRADGSPRCRQSAAGSRGDRRIARLTWFDGAVGHS